MVRNEALCVCSLQTRTKGNAKRVRTNVRWRKSVVYDVMVATSQRIAMSTL
jgi:hypothetical protein